jgi:hypothetical protein
MKLANSIAAFLGGCFFVLAGGCVTKPPSPWQQFYRPNPSATPATTPAQAVTIRNVDWTRVDEWSQTANKEAAASDKPIEEWSEADRLARRAKLFKALQLTKAPADASVLGVSSFESGMNTDPADGTLEVFAKKIGADYAIWATHPLGVRTVTVPFPVSSSSFGSATAFSGARSATAYGSGYSTTMVPVQQERMFHGWLVYYIRNVPAAGTPPALQSKP